MVKRWRRGTPLADAEAVLVGETSDVAVQVSHDHTPGHERDFAVRAVDFFHQETVELRASGPVVVPVPDDSHTLIRKDWLLVLTRSAWDRDDVRYAAGTLVAFDYDSFLDGTATGTVLFAPDSHTSLQDVRCTATHLVLVTLHDVQTRVHTLVIGTWDRGEIGGLPELATISVIDTDPDQSDEIFLSASSYTTPPSLLHGTSHGPVSVLKQTPAFFDPDGISASQYFATSDDGTAIPYFVVRRDDVTDGPPATPTQICGPGNRFHAPDQDV